MKGKGLDRSGKSRFVREALERAQGGGEPSIDGLLAATPTLQAEARRRRRAAIAAPRRNLVPELALATFAIALVASVVVLVDRGSSQEKVVPLDSLILSGSGAGGEDVLLDAVLATEKNGG